MFFHFFHFSRAEKHTFPPNAAVTVSSTPTTADCFRGILQVGGGGGGTRPPTESMSECEISGLQQRLWWKSQLSCRWDAVREREREREAADESEVTAGDHPSKRHGRSERAESEVGGRKDRVLEKVLIKALKINWQKTKMASTLGLRRHLSNKQIVEVELTYNIKTYCKMKVKIFNQQNQKTENKTKQQQRHTTVTHQQSNNNWPQTRSVFIPWTPGETSQTNDQNHSWAWWTNHPEKELREATFWPTLLPFHQRLNNFSI